MEEEKNGKIEKPEELNAYDIRISDIRTFVSNLNASIFELKESIN